MENKPLQVDFSEDEIVDALKAVRPNPNGEETNLSYFNSCNLATKAKSMIISCTNKALPTTRKIVFG